MSEEKPDTAKPEDQQYRDEIKQALMRLRLSPKTLCSYLKAHHSIALTHDKLERFLDGRTDDINAKMLGDISGVLAQMPEPPRVSRPISKRDNIEITPAMREALSVELARTGVQPALLVRRKPERLTHLTTTKISNWRTGRSSWANPEEWAYIIGVLKKLPDRRI